MTTYLTSSSYVKDFINLHGMPDLIQVRKIFDSAIKAKQWEERVISKGKLFLSPLWLNKGNNNSFKDVVMDTDIAKRISTVKLKKSKERKDQFGSKTVYNNGDDEIRLYSHETVPDGFIKGNKPTEKRLNHYKKLNDLTLEERDRRAKLVSLKTKGKKKPDDFGEKVSKGLKGIKRPQFCGENNNSNTTEAKAKISKSWENRELGIWIYFPKTGQELYAKPSEHNIDQMYTEGWIKGKPSSKGAWYNNGQNNFWILDKDKENRIQNLSLGKLQSKIVKHWITNGIDSKRVITSESIPDGWYKGRTLNENSSK